MADMNANIVVGMDNTPAVAGSKELVKASKDMETKVVASANKTEQALQQIGTTTQAAAKTATTATAQVATATKKLSGVATEAAKQQRQLVSTQASGEQRRKTTAEAQTGRANLKVVEADQRKGVITFRESEKQKSFIFRDETFKRNRIANQARKEQEADARRLDTILKRSMLGPAQVQAQASAALQGQRAFALRQNMIGVGATPGQAFAAQLGAAGLTAQQANFLVAGGRRPAGFQTPTAAGGRGGGGLAGFGRRLLGAGGGGIAGSLASGIAGGLGIGLGGYAIARAGGAIIEAQQTAVAYERQRLAAANLAGSQEKLNALLDAYTVASGGAVDKTTTLANVTRLLSTGYAETVQETERFVRATRGASIALGKPQEYVIQETQLAISNISIKRLDQIGLGIEEVQTKIKELRKENAGWNRETAFQEAVLTLMEEKYSALTESVEGQATEVEKLAKNWRDLGLAIGEAARGPLSLGAKAINALLTAPPGREEYEKKREERLNRLDDATLSTRGFAGVTLYELMGMATGRTGTQVRAQMALNSGTYSNRPATGYIGGPEDYSAAARGPKYNEDQMAVLSNYYDQFNKLERDYARNRLNEIQQYEEQRSSIIRNFAKQTAREEQDFQRQRARGLRDYERSIVDLMRDASERESELREDLDDRLADLREASGDRIKELEEDFQKDREKAEKEHKDRMLTAAGQLDAIAILEERKRWKRENEEKNENHKDALDEQRKSLAKQIEEAKESYEERLEDARKADARRLEDMAADRARQLADEDEDRALQKERAAEDYQDQLDELDRQHAITLERLATEAEDNRKALEDALAADLKEVGIYVEGYIEKMTAKDKAIEKWFEGIVTKIEEIVNAESKRTTDVPTRWPKLTPGFANGGPVNTTGPAFLHAGEFVLSRAMLASNTMNNSSYNNRNVTFESGAIQVQTIPGAEFMVADLVEERLVSLLGAI